MFNKEGKYQEAIESLRRAKPAVPETATRCLNWLGRAGTVDLMHGASSNARTTFVADRKNHSAHFLPAQITHKHGDNFTALRELSIAESPSETESEPDILRRAEENRGSPR